MLKIGILVPCRNEEGNLITLVNFLCEVIRDDEVLILIEGGSYDKTWEVCLDLQKSNPQRIVAIQQSGVGKLNALVEGIATIECSGYVIWDGDDTVGQMSGLEILNFVREHDNCVVVGNRLMNRNDSSAIPFLKRFGNLIISLTFRIFLLRNFVDVLCGIKYFPRTVALRINESHLRNDFFGDFSWILEGFLLGLPIQSIQVTYSKRKYGKSNISYFNGGFRILRGFVFFYTRVFFVKVLRRWT